VNVKYIILRLVFQCLVANPEVGKFFDGFDKLRKEGQKCPMHRKIAR
jgi:hypothetical protein